ncbi:hypothetical protein BJ508DRAFT_314117 [Ascobolus immersus RN42]|uniref:Uncharacterized protein n=1 Tax=Ascobolus immersus RN42 TaxID=1160509 RepID=A0A3N4HTX8_ASCIM|nr:hypothetical protein BJ508DRAFT_314117 [Ascobolus immersus RN42]
MTAKIETLAEGSEGAKEEARLEDSTKADATNPTPDADNSLHSSTASDLVLSQSSSTAPSKDEGETLNKDDKGQKREEEVAEVKVGASMGHHCQWQTLFQQQQTLFHQYQVLFQQHQGFFQQQQASLQQQQAQASRMGSYSQSSEKASIPRFQYPADIGRTEQSLTPFYGGGYPESQTVAAAGAPPHFDIIEQPNPDNYGGRPADETLGPHIEPEEARLFADRALIPLLAANLPTRVSTLPVGPDLPQPEEPQSSLGSGPSCNWRNPLSGLKALLWRH